MNPVGASFRGKHRLASIRAISGLLIWAGVSAVASAMSFYGETDRDPLSYSAGQEMVFTIELREEGKPISGKILKWQRQGDDGLTESGQAVSGEKPLVVAGGSPGGFQALAAAGLDASVSECYAFIPWMCNIGMEKQGRVPATFLPAYTDALRYFDSANHAKRIRARVLIDSGLGDTVCPPAAQAVLYNSIVAPKKIIFHQGMQHSHPMPGGKAYFFSEGWR